MEHITALEWEAGQSDVGTVTRTFYTKATYNVP